MADADVVLPVTGLIYVGAVDAAAPTSLSAPGVAWTSLGNTSADNLPEFGSDGGKTDTLGTWQNPAIRTSVTAAVEQVKFKLDEFTNAAFQLYYGQSSLTGAGAVVGRYDVNTVGHIEKALLIIVQDGTHYVGFHASKASIGRDDSIKLDETKLSELPLVANILQSPTKPLF